MIKKSLIKRFEDIEDIIGIILTVFFIIWGNCRIIYVSLTSTNEDKYLILYYPIAYLLTYCAPGLFTRSFKYEKPINKIFTRLFVVIFIGGLGCMI